MNVTIRGLRASTKQIMDTVSQGQTVTITKRGKACAKIVPVFEKKKNGASQAIFGMWKKRKEIKNVNAYVRDLRKGRYAR